MSRRPVSSVDTVQFTMDGHRGNKGRPTSLPLNVTTQTSVRLDEAARSPRSSTPVLDIWYPRKPRASPTQAGSPLLVHVNGPPPGFAAIPKIHVSPPSPRRSMDTTAATPDSVTSSPNLDRHVLIRRRICALMDGYAKAKKMELNILGLVEATFPGENLHIFLDTLSRQVLCDPMFQIGQTIASTMIRSLMNRGTVLESAVVDTISKGVIKDLGNLLVLPHGTNDLAGFLADVFVGEPDLKWLMTLTDTVPRHSAASTEIIHGVIETLKLRMPLAELESKIKNTLNNNKGSK